MQPFVQRRRQIHPFEVLNGPTHVIQVTLSTDQPRSRYDVKYVSWRKAFHYKKKRQGWQIIYSSVIPIVKMLFSAVVPTYFLVAIVLNAFLQQYKNQ